MIPCLRKGGCMAKNHSEYVYEQKRLIAQFIGCEDCFEDLSAGMEDFDGSIYEIEGMIDYCICIGDEKELAYWRRMLQQVKVEKRHAKKVQRMMENNKRMEIAFT